MTEQVGPRVETLAGRVLRPRDTTLVVSVREITRSRGGEELWTGDSVSVAFSGVDAVSIRRFDRHRTFLAVAGAAIGIVLLRGAIEESGILGAWANRSQEASELLKAAPRRWPQPFLEVTARRYPKLNT